jgi:hypothetical protein
MSTQHEATLGATDGRQLSPIHRLVHWAANLLAALGAWAGRNGPTGPVAKPISLTDAPDRPPAERLAEIRLLDSAVAAGVLTPTNAWLVQATRHSGAISLRTAAQRLNISYNAAKLRRRSTERRYEAWRGDVDRAGGTWFVGRVLTESPVDRPAEGR